MNASSGILVLLALTPLASAQGEIFGIDLRQDRSFSSRTFSFVGNFIELSPETRSLFAIDWNADGTVLYGIDNVTHEIVTIDEDTGVSTATGNTVTGVLAPGGLALLTGLTAAADGTTWYLSEFDGANTFLLSGDITTGVFSRVSSQRTAIGLVIDIAINQAGDLYGLLLSTDNLLSIDPSNGGGVPVGAIGLNADFAQGMDFDPTTGELYAAIYLGGGAGQFCTLNLANGSATLLEDTMVLDAEMEIAIRIPDTPVGNTYCTTNLNSTGGEATISADGTNAVADNDLTLTATGLPAFAFGFFIVSSTQGFVMNPGGSSGDLCVTGSIGRYVGPGQIQNSGNGGTFSLTVDLTAIPQPNGPISTSAGDTLNFQTWFRDALPSGSATSNFTNGLEIVFI